jgi:hypothetical protein
MDYKGVAMPKSFAIFLIFMQSLAPLHATTLEQDCNSLNIRISNLEKINHYHRQCRTKFAAASMHMLLLCPSIKKDTNSREHLANVFRLVSSAEWLNCQREDLIVKAKYRILRLYKRLTP